MTDNSKEEKTVPKSVPSSEAKVLTWGQKLEQGLPLNTYDEIKADADFNYRQRLREQQEREEFEARKRGIESARLEANRKKGNQ